MLKYILTVAGFMVAYVVLVNLLFHASVGFIFDLTGLPFFFWTVVFVSIAVATRPPALLIAFTVAASYALMDFYYQLGIPPGLQFVGAIVCIVWGVGLLILVLNVIGAEKVEERRGRGVIASAAFLLTLGVPLLWTSFDAERAASAALRTIATEPVPCTPQPMIAHISDLHLVDPRSSATGQTLDGSDPGNVYLPSLVRAIAARNPAYLVISGDLTDSGASEEWNEVRKDLAELPATTRVVVSPGNHDVHPAFGHDTFRSVADDVLASDPNGVDKVGRVVQLQAFLNPDVTTAQGRNLTTWVAGIPTEAGLRAGKYKEQIDVCAARLLAEQEFEKQQRRIREANNPRGQNSPPRQRIEQELTPQTAGIVCGDIGEIRKEYFRSTEDQFPWQLRDDERSVTFFVLSSSHITDSTFGRNALGSISDEQLERLTKQLEQTTTRNVVIVLHHPVTIAEQEHRFPWSQLNQSLTGPSRGLAMAWFQLTDSNWWAAAFLRSDNRQAKKLLSLLERKSSQRSGPRIFVLFGHRHKRSLGTINGITFVEAPSIARVNGYYATDGRDLTVSWCDSR